MTDPILFWNEVAIEANRVSHTSGSKEQNGPPLSARALAIVHLAMYDAYAGVKKDPANFPPYLTSAPAPAGSTEAGVVAGAAYTALLALFPSMKTYFDTQLSLAGGVLNPGYDYGHTVALAILNDRKGDPGVGSDGYVISHARGKHRPDPDNPEQGIHAPFYGARSRGFSILPRRPLKTRNTTGRSKRCGAKASLPS